MPTKRAVIITTYSHYSHQFSIAGSAEGGLCPGAGLPALPTVPATGENATPKMLGNTDSHVILGDWG